MNQKANTSLAAFVFLLVLTVSSAASAQKCLSKRSCAAPSEKGLWYFEGGPAGLALHEGILWVVASSQQGFVSRIDTRTGVILPRIDVGRDPVGLAIAHDSVWVVNRYDGTVSRIDPTTRAVVATIPVGTTPVNIAASANALWVTNSLSGSVSKIDPQTNRTIATVEIGAPCSPGTHSQPSAHCSMPIGMAVNENTVWIADFEDAKVVRIDATTNQILGEPISVGEGPEVIVVNGGAAWVAISFGEARFRKCRDACGRGVSRIDLETHQVVATIPLAGRPIGLAIDGDAIWVSQADRNNIIKIDSKTNSIAGEPIRVATQPSLMAVGERAIWVSSTDTQLLSRVPLN